MRVCGSAASEQINLGMKRYIANPVVTWRARLTALFILLVLAGCGAGIGHGCILCGPFADHLRGSVRGMVGSRLTLHDPSTPHAPPNAPAAHGRNVLFGIVNLPTIYASTVAPKPRHT